MKWLFSGRQKRCKTDQNNENQSKKHQKSSNFQNFPQSPKREKSLFFFKRGSSRGCGAAAAASAAAVAVRPDRTPSASSGHLMIPEILNFDPSVTQRLRTSTSILNCGIDFIRYLMTPSVACPLPHSFAKPSLLGKRGFRKFVCGAAFALLLLLTELGIFSLILFRIRTLLQM